jgi:predicted nucleic acid-binding Zn ribbon protein
MSKRKPLHWCCVCAKPFDTVGHVHDQDGFAMITCSFECQELYWKNERKLKGIND